MKINTIKKEKTIEEVVRVEYIAGDGQVFSTEDECKKYEESALFAISKQLKRLTEREISQNEIHDDSCVEEIVEIFDIQTEKDLDNLKKYLYLRAMKNGASEEIIDSCFTSKDGKRKDFVIENVTVGHEVMIFWTYDEDCFWVYKDGSINGYCEYFKERITKLITPESKEEKPKC